jgi:hypothetical protein
MLGRNIDGTWDIIHMQDYSGNDYETISTYIMDNHIKYNGKFIVTDRGGGDLYNNTIKLSGRIPFHTHWSVNYTGPNTAFIAKPPADSGYAYANLVMMNKMESITSLFRVIKKDKPGLRCYQYPLAERALSDFTNILRVPQDTDLGESKLKFIKHPSKSDDFVQAINIALHIGRVIYGEPVTDDSKTLIAIRQVAHADQSGRGLRGYSQTI